LLPGSLRVATDSSASSPGGARAAAPLEVCHLASGDLWAGAEVQTATLLKYLARDSKLQICAILLNRGRLAEEIERQGTALKVIPESEISFGRIVREASRFLAGRQVRIIHSHRYKENLIAAWVARRCKIPHLVRTQHGLLEPHRGLRALRQRLVLALDTQVARRSTDRVIGVSNEMTRVLAQSFGAQKVVTIPNGVDLESVRTSLTPQQARERLGLAPYDAVLGAVGRLEPVKRLDIFLRAAAQIAAQRADARFVTAESGRDARHCRPRTISRASR
jgi:glycosyltransferase involved in cell wall biosynthesis